MMESKRFLLNILFTSLWMKLSTVPAVNSKCTIDKSMSICSETSCNQLTDCACKNSNAECHQTCSTHSCPRMFCNATQKCNQDLRKYKTQINQMEVITKSAEQICDKGSSCDNLQCIADHKCNITCDHASTCESMNCKSGKECHMKCSFASKCPSMRCSSPNCTLTCSNGATLCYHMECGENTNDCYLNCLRGATCTMLCKSKNCHYNIDKDSKGTIQTNSSPQSNMYRMASLWFYCFIIVFVTRRLSYN